MKKKLTAILLTLCMVLGMLPMSAFAAWKTDSDKDVTWGGPVTIDGDQYYSLKVDGSQYYIFGNAAPGITDPVNYYSYSNSEFKKVGIVKWVENQEKTYTITFKYDDGVTKDLTVKTNANGTVTLPEKPIRDGYNFAGWYNGDEEVTASTVFTADTTVTAKWTPKDVDLQDYYVKLTPAKNGTVTLAGVTDGYATEKSEVTVTADPDDGYELDKITVKGDDGAVISVANSKFTMPSQGVTVTVTFKAIKYKVTVEKAENGTVTADKTTAAKGDIVTVTATPAEGYELDKITVTGAELTGNRFTMPAGDVTVTATFKALPPATFAITAVASPAEGGTVTTEPTKAQAGDTVKINVTPSTGWKTVKVMAGDVDASETYSFTMPETNVTVTAFFERISVTVEAPEQTKDPETGNVSATVDKDAIANAAQDSGAAAIVIPVTGEDAEAAPEVSVTLPAGIDEAAGDKAVTIETPAASVTLDAEALAAVKDGATITVAKETEVEAKNEDGSAITGEDGNPIKVETVKVEVKDAAGTVEAVEVSAKVAEGAKTMWVVPMINGKPGKAIQVPVSNGKVTWKGEPGTAYAVVTEEVAKALGVTETKVTGVSLDETEITLKKGATKTLTATVAPADAGNQNVTWSTSDDKIATVDQTGKVTAVAKGEATITVTTEDGGYTAACKVTVTETSGGGGGGGGGGGSAISHSVTVGNTKNGSIRVSSSDAVKGEKVTVTVRPNDGYVLDTLTVKDANGEEITLTKVNDTTYTFIMPETKVTVDGAFKAADGSGEAEDKGFTDVAKDYTFYGDITWVAGKGYMNGYADGTFRPTANTTRQALWMVLARIDGANPADMAAARAWAVEKKISDGTNPASAMSRQQMVAMLYRYAQLKGYKLDGGVSLDSFSDAASVADYAKDAMSWAVGNGIVQGTGSGTLNPTGVASRAHFAAFLHRFCQTAGIA